MMRCPHCNRDVAAFRLIRTSECIHCGQHIVVFVKNRGRLILILAITMGAQVALGLASAGEYITPRQAYVGLFLATLIVALIGVWGAISFELRANAQHPK